MDKPIETVRDLIRRLGSQRATAALFGVRPTAVSQWVANDKLPPARLYRAKLLLAERGVVIDEAALWRLAGEGGG